MFVVEVYAAVRHFVFVEGNSQRDAARVFGLSRETISKMCRFSLPPGYRRVKPVTKPKLGPLLPVIDAILEADGTAPMKQRHTAKRIFERLRDEHGYAGGLTVVKDHVRIARGRLRETFVPLAHPPGHAQVDFGEAVAVIGGIRQKIHFFCMDVPQSDAPLVKAYPRETTEAFLDGHVSAFAFFGGVPLSILCDYVPGHVIVVLFPARLCAPQPVDPSVLNDIEAHNDQRPASHSRSFGSLCQTGFRGGPTEEVEGT